ncbi:hypothetical protein M405DRAFT_540164 [Rhizopogon salebrosus TDB-379]|nr:hypothetical protein M405DRAFT_540164 [Rhizopogon salebrosus TDB-379]
MRARTTTTLLHSIQVCFSHLRRSGFCPNDSIGIAPSRTRPACLSVQAGLPYGAPRFNILFISSSIPMYSVDSSVSKGWVFHTGYFTEMLLRVQFRTGYTY